MRLLDAVEVGLANLRQAKLRGGLTALGVAIGVGGLTAMLSLGIGLQSQAPDYDVGMGGASLVVTGGSGRRVASSSERPTATLQSATSTRRRVSGGPQLLDDSALLGIAALTNVTDVYPNLRVPLELGYGDKLERTTAVGVSDAACGQGAFGTPLLGACVSSHSENQCIVGSGLAQRLDPKSPLPLMNKEVSLRYAALADPNSGGPTFEVRRVEVRCYVVGVSRDRFGAASAGSTGGEVALPLALARSIGDHIALTQQRLMLSNATHTYQAASVLVDLPEHVERVRVAINKMGLNATSASSAERNLNRGFWVLDSILALVGSVGLIVASLGILNTMAMAILERAREIAIMKAIGASDRDVGTMFLIESAVIGLAGGMGGVVLGWLIGRIANLIANYYARASGRLNTDIFALSPVLVVLSIGFAVVASLIAGGYPARLAARLRPVDGLRRD